MDNSIARVGNLRPGEKDRCRRPRGERGHGQAPDQGPALRRIAVEEVDRDASRLHSPGVPEQDLHLERGPLARRFWREVEIGVRDRQVRRVRSAGDERERRRVVAFFHLGNEIVRIEHHPEAERARPGHSPGDREHSCSARSYLHRPFLDRSDLFPIDHFIANEKRRRQQGSAVSDGRLKTHVRARVGGVEEDDVRDGDGKIDTRSRRFLRAGDVVVFPRFRDEARRIHHGGEAMRSGYRDLAREEDRDCGLRSHGYDLLADELSRARIPRPELNRDRGHSTRAAIPQRDADSDDRWQKIGRGRREGDAFGADLEIRRLRRRIHFQGEKAAIVRLIGLGRDVFWIDDRDQRVGSGRLRLLPGRFEVHLFARRKRRNEQIGGDLSAAHLRATVEDAHRTHRQRCAATVANAKLQADGLARRRGRGDGRKRGRELPVRQRGPAQRLHDPRRREDAALPTSFEGLAAGKEARGGRRVYEIEAPALTQHEQRFRRCMRRARRVSESAVGVLTRRKPRQSRLRGGGFASRKQRPDGICSDRNEPRAAGDATPAAVGVLALTQGRDGETLLKAGRTGGESQCRIERIGAVPNRGPPTAVGILRGTERRAQRCELRADAEPSEK